MGQWSSGFRREGVDVGDHFTDLLGEIDGRT